MATSNQLQIEGIPSTIPERIAAVQRSRILGAVNELLTYTDDDIQIRIWNPARVTSQQVPRFSPIVQGKHSNSIEEHTQHYQPQPARYTFAQLVLPTLVMENIEAAIDLIQVETLVFSTWGLGQIEPFPHTALNFYGPPGTGKTLAAHALADRLQRPILSASYADIESKYHGDGPKNVAAIFQAASSANAVLFIDEADSLLSKRLTSVTQGSEQAINSMRSQLLISLEQFRGIVVFATNLVENYDRAFETRVRHIQFALPDEPARSAIWRNHLPAPLPLSDDVSPDRLAAYADNISGREIKYAVIDAAVRAARRHQNRITFADLTRAIDRIKAARLSDADSTSRVLIGEEAHAVVQHLRRSFEAE